MFKRISLTFKRIIEALKDPNMERSVFDITIKLVFDKFTSINPLVKDIAPSHHTINGIQSYKVSINLVEQKSIDIIFISKNGILQVEYHIVFNENGQIGLNDVLDIAKDLKHRIITLVNQFFGTINLNN